MPDETPNPDHELAEFLADRLHERQKQADTMRANSAAGQWVGVDPAEIAANLEQSVTAGRRALQLYQLGKIGVLALKLWAFSFAGHPDFREEWRP